jgi:serine protease Do
MRVWLATTAILATAAIGPTAGAQTRWHNDDLAWMAPEAAQAVRLLKSGAGAQIGVTIRDLTDEDLKGKAATGGVSVENVEAESPAEKAGFKAGDIVVEFDGERVRSGRQFTRLVQESATGRTVPAAVLRDGQRVALNVQPREGGFRFVDGFPPVPPVPPTPPAPLARSFKFDGPVIARMFGGRLGVTVSELSPQLAEYFGTKEGVLVTTVNESSAAAKAGVKAGDVITAIDGEAVDDATTLSRRAQRLDSGDEFALTIVRDRKTMTLKGKVEAAPKAATRTVL